MDKHLKTTHYTLNLAGTLGLMLFTLLVGGTLASSHASADSSASTTASVTVGSACNFTTSDGSYSATIANGTNDEIEGDAITVSCNDSNGYAIYAIGYSGDSYDSATHTDMITPLGDSYNIKTGGSGTYGSDWQMKLTAGTNATLANSFGSYQNIPGSFTKVASYSGSTTAGTITPTYKVSISSTQPAGTYVGKVKYTLVHPSTETPSQPVACAAGKICYNANSRDTVGTMGQQSVSSYTTSATLMASNFSRAGYGFAGWNDQFDYSGNFYGPQETITFTAGQYSGTNGGLPLYAVWVPSAGSLQYDAASVCSNLTTAPTDGTANLTSVSALTDERDNETYAIAKLADGNCWMIENLRLESTAAHNSDGSLAQGYGTSATYGNFSGLADAENTNFTADISSSAEPTAPTAANSLYYAGAQSGTATINISQTNYASLRMPRYNNYNHQATSANRPQNPTSSTATNSTTNAGMYSYGNYYTWHAAIADTAYYGSGDYNTTSICPTNWMVPLGGTSTGDLAQGEADAANRVGGFSYLDRKIGGTGHAETTGESSRRWRKFPNNIILSGEFEASSADYRGMEGSYWSSTVTWVDTLGRNTHSSALSLDILFLYPPGDNPQNRGFSIRCLLGSS